MKKVILLIIATLLFVSCTEKKKVDAQTQKNDTTVKKEVAEKEMPIKKIQPLTADSFSKGQNIHNITMKSITTGKNIDFSQYKGKKILFDFWSSWCEPCIEMFPIINIFLSSKLWF